MTDKFARVWAKLERAKYHAHKFQRDVLAYWKSNPYEIVAQQEGNDDFVWRIKSVRDPMPPSLVMTTGDAIHNLRSAFDHFAYVSVSQPHNRNVAFPVWRKGPPSYRGGLEGLRQRNAQRRRPSTYQSRHRVAVLRGRTEEWFRSIDELDVIDKHHLLLAVASASTGITIDGSEAFRRMRPDREFPDMPLTIKSADWDPIEPGLKIFSVENSVGPGDHANT